MKSREEHDPMLLFRAFGLALRRLTNRCQGDGRFMKAYLANSVLGRALALLKNALPVYVCDSNAHATTDVNLRTLDAHPDCALRRRYRSMH